jgi:hypothetical protein
MPPDQNKQPGGVSVEKLRLSIDLQRQLPACPCGRRKDTCGSCNQFFCAAPGHALHVCGGGA